MPRVKVGLHKLKGGSGLPSLRLPPIQMLVPSKVFMPSTFLTGYKFGVPEEFAKISHRILAIYIVWKVIQKVSNQNS